MTLDATLAAPAADDRHRRLAIACALLDRLSDDLERLADDPALADERRRVVTPEAKLVRH
jgi:hypothetical protein